MLKDSKVSGKSTTATLTSESEEVEEQIEKMMKEELGFSLVIQALAKANKPLIGHNAIFDLAFIYHQFFSELPDTYVEFAHSLNTKLFSKFYDTKVLSLYAGKLGKSDL